MRQCIDGVNGVRPSCCVKPHGNSARFSAINIAHVDALVHTAGMDTQTAIRALMRSMSQSEIARRTGIPQYRISRWAAGATPPAADDGLKLVRLAQAVETINEMEQDNAPR